MDPYQKLLSITIMTRQIPLNEILGKCDLDQQLTFIWAETITSMKLPLRIPITLWDKSGLSPESTISYTGSLNHFRTNHRPAKLIRAGSVILLTESQMNALTQNGKEKVGCQLAVMVGRTIAGHYLKQKAKRKSKESDLGKTINWRNVKKIWKKNKKRIGKNYDKWKEDKKEVRKVPKRISRIENTTK
ncbi:uncharacterized protein LOC108103950 [Drosophila eugracilis]|uniref:uncharacterized protein LOC108103950 n=1 Tax=Drosophila eugracilis TaxID=29029 RepID=UPI0007E6C3D1|nr:uncharacterized protein LOC108103950 [Drosophila eugracilis]